MPEDLYSTESVDFLISYKLQGTYDITGHLYSRQHTEGLVRYMQGYGAEGDDGTVEDTKTVQIKVDRTIPSIDSYSACQRSLNDYSQEEIQTKLEQGILNLNTTFRAEVSDWHSADNGVFLDGGDAAGIYGVYVMVYELKDPSNMRIYRLNLDTVKETTHNKGANVLCGIYSVDVNLYLEFPTSGELLYKIYAVDNAGNHSKELDSLWGAEKLPSGTKQDGSTGEYMASGYLGNASIKTFIVNDEAEAYNIAEGEVYFQIGEFGHVEAWSVGYVESISFDFGPIGEEAAREISDRMLPMEYNLGLFEEYLTREWNRNISWTKAEAIYPAQLTYYDNGLKTVNRDRDPDAYRQVITGAICGHPTDVPYISHWSMAGWGDEGTSIRIPPYYQLSQIGTNPDGTPKYQREVWKYLIKGTKKDTSVLGMSTYILWDTKSTEVHYRVLHES